MTRSMRTGGRGALAATGGLAALLAATLLLMLAGAPRAEAYVYWSSALGSVSRSHQDGSNVAGLASGLGTGVIAIAVDDRYLWWAKTSTGALGRANRDGSDVDGSFVSASGGGTGVASDGEYVWWVSGGNVNRARRDGSDVVTGFIAGAGAHGVAVDDQHVYFTRPGAGAIGRARRDGSDVNQSFVTGASQPAGIAVSGGRLYWANGSANAIGRANADGSGVNHGFVTGQSSPGGVAADATHVYWANAATNQIGRANLDGSGVNPVFAGPTTGTNGVAVDALPMTPTLSGTRMHDGSVVVGAEPFRLRIRLDGGSHPTGSLLVRAYGPGNDTCGGVPLHEQTIPVTGNGDYTAEFTPSAAGDYRWRVFYTGDGANRSLYGGPCGLGGVFTADKRQWTVRASAAPASAVAGEPLTAQATLGAPACFAGRGGKAWDRGWGCFARPRADGVAAAGRVAPRAGGDPDASIVFRLYGPGDESCSLPPVFEDAVGVSADVGRTARSAAFVPRASGDYRWTAEYTGDDANDATVADCAEATVVEVAKAEPTLALAATQQQATAGDALDATATLTGGFEPAGELTFALHGPGDEQCTGAPVHVARVAVGAGGDASASGAGAAAIGGTSASGAGAAAIGGTSASGAGAAATEDLVARATPYAATAAGTYRWVVSYAGDDANTAVATGCGNAGAAVVVAAAPVDPGPPPLPPPAVDPAPARPAKPAPALSGFTLAGRCTRPAARGAVTVGLRLRMAQAGTVQVKVERALGTRGLARCPKANPAARFGGRFRTVVTKRSVKTAAAARVARTSATALARTVTLRLRLEPALYRITVRTRTADGRPSAPRTRFLRVLSPRG